MRAAESGYVGSFVEIRHGEMCEQGVKFPENFPVKVEVDPTGGFNT